MDPLYDLGDYVSYGPPWAHYLGGTRTDYSVGPKDYSACATRHLMAWGARTTVEEYCTV
jgi:hypothetical protein